MLPAFNGPPHNHPNGFCNPACPVWVTLNQQQNNQYRQASPMPDLESRFERMRWVRDRSASPEGRTMSRAAPSPHFPSGHGPYAGDVYHQGVSSPLPSPAPYVGPIHSTTTQQPVNKAPMAGPTAAPPNGQPGPSVQAAPPAGSQSTATAQQNQQQPVLSASQLTLNAALNASRSYVRSTNTTLLRYKVAEQYHEADIPLSTTVDDLKTLLSHRMKIKATWVQTRLFFRPSNPVRREEIYPLTKRDQTLQEAVQKAGGVPSMVVAS